MWNKLSHHHTKKFQFFFLFFYFFFPDNGVTNYYFFTTCYDKITCCEKKKNNNFRFFQKKFFKALAIMYMFVYCIYYKIHWCTHSSRFEPDTSWRHTKVLTTKLQNFINIEFKNLIYYVGYGTVSKIHILTFLFSKIYINATNENIIFEAYLIMY
jgi:hypothetical protein